MDVVLYIMTSEDQSESEDEGWAAALGEYARLLKSNIEGPDDEDIFASLRNSNESEQVDGEKNAFEQEHAVNFEAVNEEFDTNEWNEPPLVRAEQACQSSKEDKGIKGTQETQKATSKNTIPTPAPKAKDIQGEIPQKNPFFEPPVEANRSNVREVTPSPAMWYQSSQEASNVVGKDVNRVYMNTLTSRGGYDRYRIPSDVIYSTSTAKLQLLDRDASLFMRRPCSDLFPVPNVSDHCDVALPEYNNGNQDSWQYMVLRMYHLKNVDMHLLSSESVVTPEKMGTPSIDMDKGKSIDLFHSVPITRNVSRKRSFDGCNVLLEGQSSGLKKYAISTECVECKVQPDFSQTVFVASRNSYASTHVGTVDNNANLGVGFFGYVDKSDCQK
ncbi:hypothetical protein RIF29_03586 [Crotalaria pallida]|uniref:Uncharacterized protein n=1 Tax=Crotalaria pallida TaxID=3830 RepID=A0AAN9J146_CROPI